MSMENLLVRTLADYLTARMDEAFQEGGTTAKAFLFLESFPPDVLLRAFKLVDGHVAQSCDADLVLKVALPLWRHWDAEGLLVPGDREAFEGHGWIDEADHATRYRNQVAEAERGAIVVLAGVDRVQDTGGLGDFHRVDERTLWERQLNADYSPWIRRFLAYVGVDESDELVGELANTFAAIDAVTVRNLADWALFLKEAAFDRTRFATGGDVVAHVFASLGRWGLFPVGQLPKSRKKRLDLIKASAKFARREAYADLAARNRAKKSLIVLKQQVNDGNRSAPLPDALPGLDAPFEELDDFCETLNLYIETGDPATRDVLARTDFAMVHEVLGIREATTKAERVSRRHGPALMVFMTAIWDTVDAFRRSNHLGDPARVEVEVKTFHHDLGRDEAEDARALMRGLLGGIGYFLAAEGEEDAEDAALPIALTLGDAVVSSRTPYVQFEVRVLGEDAGDVVKAQYRWVVGEAHEERVLQAIARRARRDLIGKLLPAFEIDTFTELCFATDAEEASRLLGIAETGLRVRDLADAGLRADLASASALNMSLNKTQAAYRHYLEALTEQGYFHALRQPALAMIRELTGLMKGALKDHAGLRHVDDLRCALYKAFLILRKEDATWGEALPAAVACGLAPAVIEQLHAREHHLRQAFQRLLQRLLAGTGSRRELFELYGMVSLQRPILALIKDKNKAYTTQARPLGHVHLLGQAPEDVLSLASQAIMREDDLDDEDVDDGELFERSPESRIFRDKLRDYVLAFPRAYSGMSVVAIDVEDIRTLIAGVHEFLTWMTRTQGLRAQSAPPYEFSLRIYLPAKSAFGVQKWLEAWRRRWDPAKGQEIYPNCRLSIAVRPARTTPKDYVQLLQRDDERFDVAFLVRFLRAQAEGDQIEEADAFDLGEGVSLKFPITETPRPRSTAQRDRLRRYTNLSNRRLAIPTLHAALTARLAAGPSCRDFRPHRMVFAAVDYEPWTELVDALHERGRSTWVVCMDPSVDQELIGHTGAREGRRELIGFASGLGGLGELNVTVSTETHDVASLRRAVRDQLNGLFPAWSQEIAEKASRQLVDEAQRLRGFSLIQAVCAERFLREMVSSALVRRAIPHREDVLCDVMLSLDAYQHWLQQRGVPDASNMRPDLLHLVAWIGPDGDFEIAAEVIECKLAQQSDGMVERAHAQLEARAGGLVRNFLPFGLGDVGDTYMRRFWWAQLHRAIASHGRTDRLNADAVARALERLGEGRYAITWRFAAATFWTDTTAELAVHVSHGRDWSDLGLEAVPGSIAIRHLEFGTDAVTRLATGGAVEIPVAGGMMLRAGDEGTAGTWSDDAPEETPAPPEPAGEGAPENELLRTVPAAARVSLSTRPEEAHAVGTRSKGAEDPPAGGTVPPPPLAPPVPPAGGEAAPPPEASTAPPAPQPAVAATPPPRRVSAIPERVLLGTTGEKPVYWEFGHPLLANRHLLIFGRSGMGKTYAIQCLLAELARVGQATAIVDYTDGFTPSRLEAGLQAAANPVTHLVRAKPLPINPMQPLAWSDPDFGTFHEKPGQTAGRVMSVFDSVFGLGDQQRAALVEACKVAIATHGEAVTLEHVLPALEALGGAAAASAATAANKLRPFLELEAFGAGAGTWGTMYGDPEHLLHIVQLASLPREYARIITEFALWDLYNHATNSGTDKTPLPIVLDEVQNLSHRPEAPIGKILREGRKFGLAGIFATQTMSNLRSDEQDQLFQAAHKLFFAPAESEVREYAKLLHDVTGESVEDWRQRLLKLTKGECWSLGPVADAAGMRVKALRVRITPFEDRGFSCAG